jgi:hypothetical protein
MNASQTLWWEQAESDLKVLLLLRGNAADPCHQLHYLQMVTEKLAKAYFWRTGNPPAKKHAGFTQFMKALGSIHQSHQAQAHLAASLEFKNFNVLQTWIRSVMPMAYDLERLAPTLAQDGPNPEYPWPHHAPVECPARHQFTLWGQLAGSGQGRRFLHVIEIAVHKFPTYG